MRNKTDRSNESAEVVMMDDQPIVTNRMDDVPHIATLNVTRSSRVHLGPKFVNVNQTVHHSEVIKGQVLGLELVSANTSRRLRCSIAVFVCWASLVAAVIATAGISYYAFNERQIRLDIDLPLPSYLCTFIKSTTRAERVSCAASTVALIICIGLIAYYSVVTKHHLNDIVDAAPHEWNITRKMWLSRPYTYTDFIGEEFEPLKLVIIQHTVSSECDKFVICAAELRNMQSYFIKEWNYDIPYNFLIGNDGRVYEGRGWHVVGAHTFSYNWCSLGIGFIGDYREDTGTQHTKVTRSQVNRTMMLLEESVRLGYLDPNYYVVGAKDLQMTESPGTNLYNEIRTWAHYNKTLAVQFRNKNCTQIYEIISNLTD